VPPRSDRRTVAPGSGHRRRLSPRPAPHVIILAALPCPRTWRHQTMSRHQYDQPDRAHGERPIRLAGRQLDPPLGQRGRPGQWRRTSRGRPSPAADGSGSPSCAPLTTSRAGSRSAAWSPGKRPGSASWMARCENPRGRSSRPTV
jgi:hypothetical protein